MKKSLCVTVSALLCAAAVFAGGAKDAGVAKPSYPTKPVTMIIPYGAGGTTDVNGRKFAVQLQKHLGQSITIVNQGGASGSKGCKSALDAAPDGYTILFTAESLGTQRVMGISEMSYADFAPIMAVTNDPKVIVVGKDSKYNSMKDLLDDMKANPGKVKMSYTGPGGSGHVQGLILKNLGYDMAMTAYAGGSDCILAVLSKQVDFTNSNYSTIVGYLKSGDLKLLGISAVDRLPGHPDVPTIAEVDPAAKPFLKNPFTPLNLLVSKDVPVEIQQVLREAALKAVEEPEWKQFIEENCGDKLYEMYPTIDSIKQFYNEWESLVSWMLYDAGATKYSPEQFNIPRPATK
ncbi:MAG: tripartite tricarboxylate transporter substrate binding protein [Treponema sp.]|nr:tripartite tricarboxylate transporter substrate binding protein [Treponema sp.]